MGLKTMSLFVFKFGRGNSMHCQLRLRSLPTFSLVGTFGESRLHVLRTPSPFKTFRFEREALDCLSFFSFGFPAFVCFIDTMELHVYMAGSHMKHIGSDVSMQPLHHLANHPSGSPLCVSRGGGHSPKMFMAPRDISVGKETLLQ